MIDTLIAVARGEGWRAVVRRGADRLREIAIDGALLTRGSFRPSLRAAPPVLNVLAMPASSRFGGVPSQLLARLDVERTLRNVALLELRTPFAQLRVSAPPHIRRIRRYVPSASLFDECFGDAVRTALEIAGTDIVHFEGVAGVPLGTALRLNESGIRTIITIHDFSMFCARPHLLEQPAQSFCGYSRDGARCAACLAESGLAADQEERRAIAARLLGRSTLVFPSKFMLAQYRSLFPATEFRSHLIEPGAATAPARRTQNDRRVSRIAFVGAVKRHKGGALLPEIVRRGIGADAEWCVFGAGDVDLLRNVRVLPHVRVHGYYRAGALAGLLARYGIDVAVLPSIVPESFGLTLSECWLAQVPVVAFDHGALAERISEQGGGAVVPLEEGVDGIVRAIREVLSADAVAPRSVPMARDAAVSHVALYDSFH